MDMVLKLFLMVILILPTVILKNVKFVTSVELWNLEHLVFWVACMCSENYLKFGGLFTYGYHTGV